MRFAKIGRESDCMLGCRERLLAQRRTLLRIVHADGNAMQRPCAICVRLGKVRIQCNCLVESRKRITRGLAVRIRSAHDLLAAQVGIVSVRVLRAAKLELGRLIADKFHLELLRNRSRNVRLHFQNVADLSIIRLGPDMKTAHRINQLYSYSHFISRSTDAALQDRAHVQFMRDGGNIDVLPFERKRRSPSCYLQLI